MARIHTFGLLALAALLVAGSAGAEVYRWVDAKGVPHFTDRPEEVPVEFRGQALQEAAASEESQPSFRVIPGLNAREHENGEPGAAPAPARFDLEALAALEQMKGERPQLREMLKQVPREMWVKLAIGTIIGLLVVVSFAAICLTVSCRLCGEEPLSFVKGQGIAALHLVAMGSIAVLIFIYAPDAAQRTGTQGAQLGLGTAVYAALLRGLHSESVGMALAVSVVNFFVTLGITVALVVLALCAGASSFSFGSMG